MNRMRTKIDGNRIKKNRFGRDVLALILILTGLEEGDPRFGESDRMRRRRWVLKECGEDEITKLLCGNFCIPLIAF